MAKKTDHKKHLLLHLEKALEHLKAHLESHIKPEAKLICAVHDECKSKITKRGRPKSV